MNEPQRIGAFYSRGPQYVRMLRHLRNLFPSAAITAIVPPGYPEEPLAGLAQSRLETAPGRIGSRDLAAFRAVLRQIRQERFDLFVVMFDSPRLRVLAKLTGIPRCAVFPPDGRYRPLQAPRFRDAIGWVYRNLRGRLTYLRLYYIVHYKKINKNE